MSIEAARFAASNARERDRWHAQTFGAAALLAVLVGCARGPLPLAAKPPNAIKLAVPIVSQASSYSCGPAVLLSTLLYFGAFDGPETELYGELGVTPEQGTHPDRIVASARRHGLTAEKRTGTTLRDVQAAIDSGAVVILAIQAWRDEVPEAAGGGVRRTGAAQIAWDDVWDDGHYVIAVGLDDRALYVMDPSVRIGYGYIPRDELRRRWHDFEVEAGRRIEYHQLAIVIRGTAQLRRYPEGPVRVE